MVMSTNLVNWIVFLLADAVWDVSSCWAENVLALCYIVGTAGH